MQRFAYNRERRRGCGEISAASSNWNIAMTEMAVLAGGCFWGVEQILREVPGVIDTEVGYTGGWLENPTYHDTHDSASGHAEAVRVTFDPALLSYEDLLRSAIFPQTSEQKLTAELVKARVETSGVWRKPVTTTIEPPSAWYSAEDYHQDFLEKNPGGYTCHFMRG
jgi:peptide methionine sulfoxide reductase MsrA